MVEVGVLVVVVGFTVGLLLWQWIFIVDQVSWWWWRVAVVVGVGFTKGLRCWLVFSGLFEFLLLGVLGLSWW